MPLPAEFVRWADQEVRRLRSQLNELESGKTGLGSRRNGGAWTDITQEEIARLRRNIGDLQTVLDQAQGQNGG